jgi:hypothetical protein
MRTIEKKLRDEKKMLKGTLQQTPPPESSIFGGPVNLELPVDQRWGVYLVIIGVGTNFRPPTLT